MDILLAEEGTTAHVALAGIGMSYEANPVQIRTLGSELEPAAAIPVLYGPFDLGPTCGALGEVPRINLVRDPTPPPVNRTPNEIRHASAPRETSADTRRRDEVKRRVIAKRMYEGSITDQPDLGIVRDGSPRERPERARTYWIVRDHPGRVYTSPLAQ